MDAWDVINTAFIAVISIIKEIVQMMDEGLVAAQILSYSLIKDTSLYNNLVIASEIA